jgi:hypothetical protein
MLRIPNTAVFTHFWNATLSWKSANSTLGHTHVSNSSTIIILLYTIFRQKLNGGGGAGKGLRSVIQDSKEYDPADGDTEEDGDRDSAPVEESNGGVQSGEELQLPTTNGDSSRQRFLEDQCALHTRSKARDGTKIIFLIPTKTKTSY